MTSCNVPICEILPMFSFMTPVSCLILQLYSAYLSCSSPWWRQSWPYWVEGWYPPHRAGGWLVASGSYSSACFSVPRPASRPLFSSRGLAMSNSPPGDPSPRCQSTENCKRQTLSVTYPSCSNNDQKNGKYFSSVYTLVYRVCVWDNFVCVCLSLTQLRRGQWTQRATVGVFPRSPSRTDQPRGVWGRPGCLCWPP